MKRTIVIAAILAALVGSTTQAAQGAPKEWRWQECRFSSLEPGVWTRREIVLTIDCALRKWPVPGGLDLAVAVAQCESGPDLKDPGTVSPLGTYQQIALYWPGRWQFWSPAHWKKPLAPEGANPRSNVVVSVRMAHADGSWWGDWSSSAPCWA